jgi:hypothetical protein
MLRAGVSFPVLMKLLGHTSPEMAMQYLDVALTDVQREFELARSKCADLSFDCLRSTGPDQWSSYGQKTRMD